MLQSSLVVSSPVDFVAFPLFAFENTAFNSSDEKIWYGKQLKGLALI